MERGNTTKLEDVFSLDLRSLALFRVGLSLVLFYDIIDRGRSLVAHYTDQGVLPAERAAEIFGRGIYASIHFHLSESVFAVACVFGLAGLCAGALLVGYRTRLATILSWYLLASLQVRNDWVNGIAGDGLLMALLFWAIFLPLGERWSVDARRRADAPAGNGNRIFCVATAALIIQLFVMYFSTGLLKSGESWMDGSAVHYALHLGHFASPFTHLLREQAWAHPVITYATLVFEILGPFLLLVPVFIPVTRMLAVVLFIGFHTGLAIFLNVGPFPIICIAAWLALLPSALFDEWLPRLRSGASATATPAATQNGGPPRRPQGLARLLDLALTLPLLFVVTQAAVKLEWLDLGYGKALPPFAHTFGQLLRLNQNWGMFAPDPSRYTVWLAVDGRLASGESFDPLAKAPVHHSIPHDIAGSSRSYRWRAYSWLSLLKPRLRPTMQASHRDFSDFLCREWNASHAGSQRLVGLRSIGFWQETTATGVADPQPVLLYEFQCDGVGRLAW